MHTPNDKHICHFPTVNAHSIQKMIEKHSLNKSWKVLQKMLAVLIKKYIWRCNKQLTG